MFDSGLWIDFDWGCGERIESPNLDWIEPFLTAYKHLDDRQYRLRQSRVDVIYKAVVWKRDKGLCGICNTSADPFKWHLDHIIPLGPGKHSYENVRVTHPQCNIAKAADDRRIIKAWRKNTNVNLTT